jgi:hypothetical protein
VVETRAIGAPPRFSITPNELVCPLKNFVGSRIGRSGAKSESCMLAQPPRRSAAPSAKRRPTYFFFLPLFFAAASRSVFLRRAARFLTLSLPWLFPIGCTFNLSRPLPTSFARFYS